MKFSNSQTSSLRNSIFRRTIGYILLYTLIFLLCFIVFDSFVKPVVSNTIYYEILGGVSYNVYDLITSPYLFVVAFAYVVGLFLVVRSSLNRAMRYFDTLFSSLENIVSNSEELISLPDELSQTALRLNEIKTTSQRNERAAKAAEQRKNELVVYLAHDIKTPLTSIIGYLDMLTESPDMPRETRARYAGIALDKAYRLEELIEEFFEITRYNLSSIPIERANIDATLFCQQVIDDLLPQAASRDLTISLESPDQLMVFADANRLSRVLDNIVKNAISYANEGSEIWMSAENVILHDNSSWLKVMVTNVGREISPEHLDRMFEKFYRGDEARTSNSGGSGLGLAIAHEITRAHGGDITAASENGVTTFAIWIPQQDQSSMPGSEIPMPAKESAPLPPITQAQIR